MLADLSAVGPNAAAALDPTSSYLAAVATANAGTPTASTVFTLFDTATGAQLWSRNTSGGLALVSPGAAELSSTALYSIRYSKVVNEASLDAYSLATGASLAGFPVALTTAYSGTRSLTITPTGALLLSRVSFDGTASLVLLSAEGVERWVYVQQNAVNNMAVISADGTAAFVGSTCGSDFGACASATLYAVSLATGIAAATACDARAYNVVPKSPDNSSGGVFVTFPLDSSYSNRAGWASGKSSGGFAWTEDQASPYLVLVGQAIASKILFFREPSVSSSDESVLIAAPWPVQPAAVAPASSAPTAAIVGGVLGGAALAAAACYAFRKRLTAAFTRAAGAHEESALLGDATQPAGVAPRFMSGT